MRFNSLKCCWVASCRRDPGPDLESVKGGFEWDHIGGGCSAHTPRLYADSIPSNGALHSVESSSFGPAAVSQFIAICAEQDRLRTLFVSEVSRSLGGTVRRVAGRINNPLAAHCDDGYSRKSSTVEQIVRKFEKTMVRKKSAPLWLFTALSYATFCVTSPVTAVVLIRLHFFNVADSAVRETRA